MEANIQKRVFVKAQGRNWTFEFSRMKRESNDFLVKLQSFLADPKVESSMRKINKDPTSQEELRE